MSYTKQTWQTGDIITAAKLNHMEDGVANTNTLIVNVNESGVCDKTWQQVYDAFPNVRIVVDATEYAPSHVSTPDAGYYVVEAAVAYEAESANGYLRQSS